MNGSSVFVIFLGAGIGALLRWVLGLALNPLFPLLPLGTLAANVLGGFLMGAALVLFAEFQAWPPAIRLAATTGFLGGLTTFSTFSAETVNLLLKKEFAWACALVGVHVVGSLLATLGGLAVARLAFASHS